VDCPQFIIEYGRIEKIGTKPTRGPAKPMPSHSSMLAAKLLKELEKGNK
jgi:hypothetical protein